MALTAKLLGSGIGAQGAQGSTTQLVNGTPSLGADGDIAIDYATPRVFPARANGAWPSSAVSLAGSRGDTGVSGAASAPKLQYVPVAGPEATFIATTAAQTAAQIIPYPGQSQPAPFSSADLAYFGGATLVVTTGNSNASGIKFSLRNASTGAVIYTSGSYSYGTVNYVGDFGTSYPMPAGQPYIWYITGAGGAAFMCKPFYKVLASGFTPAIMQMHPAYLYSQTMSSTAVILKPPGSTGTGNITGYAISPYYGLLYEATLYNGGSGSVTYQLYNATTSSIVFSQAVSSGQTLNVGPFPDYSYRVPNGQQVYWRATGSGNGSGWVQWRCWA